MTAWLIGINVDPANQPLGNPAQALLRSLGFGGVRLVLRPGCRQYVDDCHDAGLQVLGVVARESGEPAQYAGWPLSLLQVGNEPDARSDSSWTMGPGEFYGLWYGVRHLFPDTPLVIGGMASGNPYRAEAYCAVEGASYLAVHPYAKSAPVARTLLRQYREICQLPLLVTEWNRPAEEIGEFMGMLAEEAEGAWWYAATNAMSDGFGLLDVPEKLAAMKEAIMSLANEAGVLEKRVELLEKQQGMTVEVLKLMLQGRWTAEMPHAEALLKAINPADIDWHAVPFAQPEA